MTRPNSTEAQIISSKYYINSGFWLNTGLLSALSSNSVITLSSTASPNAFTIRLSHQSTCSFFRETSLPFIWLIPLVLLGLFRNTGLFKPYLDLGTFCFQKRYNQRWCICLFQLQLKQGAQICWKGLRLCYCMVMLYHCSPLLCIYIFQTFLRTKSFM